MLTEQFKPYIISPCHDNYYLLENGAVILKAQLSNNIHFHCYSPSLILVDYEQLDNKVEITEVHLIATNVDKVKLLSWLYSIHENLIGYLVILIGLITKINDYQLRAEFVEVIFHEQLHPNHFIESGNKKMDSLYPSLILTGQRAFLKCQKYNCSQILRDTLLVNCLLKRLAKNELISYSPECIVVKKLIDEKLDKIIV
ncbi:MAG: hypothetical protein ACI9LM_003309 [Alteromonadaceae bacterium]|jgi:hypothetical protein